MQIWQNVIFILKSSLSIHLHDRLLAVDVAERQSMSPIAKIEIAIAIPIPIFIKNWDRDPDPDRHLKNVRRSFRRSFYLHMLYQFHEKLSQQLAN